MPFGGKRSKLTREEIEVDFSREERSDSKRTVSEYFYNNVRDKSGSGPTVKTSTFDKDHPLVTMMT